MTRKGCSRIHRPGPKHSAWEYAAIRHYGKVQRTGICDFDTTNKEYGYDDVCLFCKYGKREKEE